MNETQIQAARSAFLADDFKTLRAVFRAAREHKLWAQAITAEFGPPSIRTNWAWLDENEHPTAKCLQVFPQVGESMERARRCIARGLLLDAHVWSVW